MVGVLNKYPKVINTNINAKTILPDLLLAQMVIAKMTMALGNQDPANKCTDHENLFTVVFLQIYKIPNPTMKVS